MRAQHQYCPQDQLVRAPQWLCTPGLGNTPPGTMPHTSGLTKLRIGDVVINVFKLRSKYMRTAKAWLAGCVPKCASPAWLTSRRRHAAWEVDSTSPLAGGGGTRAPAIHVAHMGQCTREMWIPNDNGNALPRGRRRGTWVRLAARHSQVTAGEHVWGASEPLPNTA